MEDLLAVVCIDMGVTEAESCAPTKKACKNCTCGRAELEEKEEETKLTAAQINNPTSSCGSVSGQFYLKKRTVILCFAKFIILLRSCATFYDLVSMARNRHVYTLSGLFLLGASLKLACAWKW